MAEHITYEMELLKNCRKHFFRLSKNLTVEQLNLIPKRHNNNIIWNIGHVIVSQHQMFYSLSGNGFTLPKEWVDFFQRGSKPETVHSIEMYQALRKASDRVFDEFPDEYAKGKFDEYHAIDTLYGSGISSIDEAISFNLVHENLHLGVVLGLLKDVQ